MIYAIISIIIGMVVFIVVQTVNSIKRREDRKTFEK